MIGSQLANYRITAALGAGGMGGVWRATDTKLDREVARKALPGGCAEGPERLALFEREAKMLASLNHPNIARLCGLETVASGAGTGTGNVHRKGEGERDAATPQTLKLHDVPRRGAPRGSRTIERERRS